MIERTYINKYNTIIEGYENNTSLNPISELVYGADLTRALVYFDHSKIKRMIDDGTFGDPSKLTHRLKITNAGSIDFSQMHLKEESSINATHMKQRASSFDLIFFLIPKEWDAGKGYDYSKTFYEEDFIDTRRKDVKYLSDDGCNWYQRRNGYVWEEEGIFSNTTLEKEYQKWAVGEESIIIGRQRFQVGNENIDIDITDVMNKFISGELENHGIGIAFAPDYEKMELTIEEYVGFLTDKTNTLYAPFVETTYDSFISDDRANMVLNKTNKLYLYSTIGGKLTDLDQTPTCSIKDADGNDVFHELEVKKYSQGIYYVEVMFPVSDFKADTQYFDTWDDIFFNGAKFDPVELYFTLKSTSNWFTIGNSIEETPDFTPQISGINSNERIKRGDIRKLSITARVNYSQKQSQLIDGIEVRFYVMDGNREVTVFDFEKVNKTYNENYISIDTNNFLPQIYHVDVKIKYGMEEILHHDMLKFEIVNDLQNKYF